MDRGLNVRQTEALAATRPKAADPAKPSVSAPKDVETAALEHDLSAHLGLKVAIHHQGKGGQVTIRYRDLDQLDGLITLLRGRGG